MYNMHIVIAFCQFMTYITKKIITIMIDLFLCCRHFLLVDWNGKYVVQYRVPTVCLLRPSLHVDVMHVDAPGMDTLKIPLDPDNYKDNRILDINME